VYDTEPMDLVIACLFMYHDVDYALPSLHGISMDQAIIDHVKVGL
jgi:hypothetical protein